MDIPEPLAKVSDFTKIINDTNTFYYFIPCVLGCALQMAILAAQAQLDLMANLAKVSDLQIADS